MWVRKMFIMSSISLNNSLCTKCNYNYYPKENDPSNFGDYINCYNEQPEGYYLDENIYKKCYKTCKTCNAKGNDKNHNCIECNENFQYAIQKDDYKNCFEYENASYYYDNENNILSTIKISYSDKYTQLINFPSTINSYYSDEYIKFTENSVESVEYYDFESIKEMVKNKRNEAHKSKEEEIIYYDDILKNIEEIFASENYNTYNLDNGYDDYIKIEKISLRFSTITNQKNNIYNNMTTIDLLYCENLLRNYYNLSINETLYMKIIDIAQENTKASKIEYDIYCKLFNSKLIKLNLTACSNSKISIFIPFELNDNIDKYNITSGYYNDICYTTTSRDGTDITLKDRQKNYIDEDKIICQENCEFSKYNSEYFKAECSCNVKESSQSIADMIIDKKKLCENFKNIKNFANFHFLVCYKKLFNKKNIINNIGSYILIFVIIFHILVIVIFRLNQYSLIYTKLKDITLCIL